jgi:hypothetical protein
MPREIKSLTDTSTTQLASNQTPDQYRDRLVKLIPSEIITAYITLKGLITGQTNEPLYLLITCVCLLALTPLYLKNISHVNKPGQIIFASIAFVIWIMASGGFQTMFPNIKVFMHESFIGSYILIIYTLLIPFVYKG